jgi:serine/threonine protein kinase/ABC-type sulfate transport system substrate-binding protein
MIKANEWTGCEIAEGRYVVLARIGAGSMGQVYRARDCHLETEVVIKCPVPPDASVLEPEFLKRFDLEIRSLVKLSHPHIVRIIDVGTFQGLPYVVMQYLSGGSLKSRMLSRERGEREAMPPVSLGDWLMDVAKALDFIHGQNYLHRDVKPDNILFDHHGNAFLSDFGIIKMLAAEGEDWGSSAMTAPGYLMGTPNYVAPEVVLGGPIDARLDQYSLAMTVHEALSGTNFMEGSTPSATMVNQTKLMPPPLVDLLPGVSLRLSDAILRGLAKSPSARFENCVAFATEALSEVCPGSSTSSGSQRIAKLVDGGACADGPGRAACPICHSIFQLGDEYIGEQIRCTRCRTTLLVRRTKPDTFALDMVSPPSASWARRSPELDSYGSERSGPIAGGVSNAETFGGGTFQTTVPARSRIGRWLTYATIGVVLLTCGLFLRREFINSRVDQSQKGADQAATGAGDSGLPAGAAGHAPAAAAAEVEPTIINIAYGTEKKKWLEDALREFLKTPAGQHLQINLIGMGSVEGAMAVLDGPHPSLPPHQPIHVWSPASSAYRDVLETEWRVNNHGTSPILAAENLALTPMVFVMWKQRHEAFVKKYTTVNFRTIAQAMKEPEGWGTIGAKAEWGLFKFGHTDPNKSNSGLQSLVLMAYELADKQRGLTVKDITQDEFQRWLRDFERNVTRHGSSLTHSTGTLMEEMVLRGPSQYDCLIVYENLVIDYMKTAGERWGEAGEFHVAYPAPNIWNEHPYYILDVPWSNDAQRKGASDFLKFLMSENVQRRALAHGFRPGNASVPVNAADSPLVRNEKYGIKIDLPNMCEPPAAEVVTNLLGSFRRIER